jgi:hypothetical protein
VSGLDLPSVTAPGAIPAEVRRAGAEAQRTYRAALGFERMLLGELTKTLSTGAAGEGDSGAEGQSAATTAYRDMLPGALADAVAGAGGLGVAPDLYRMLRSEP